MISGAHWVLAKAAGFARQPGFVRAWFLPVWLSLGLARLLILRVPIRHYAAWLGCRSDGAPWLPLVEAADEARARAISQVVRLAARYTPWQSNCFPQAIVARFLLRLHRIPHALFLGAAPADGRSLAAHAWVAAGPVRVTGGDGFGRFGVLGCFVYPPPGNPP